MRRLDEATVQAVRTEGEGIAAERDRDQRPADAFGAETVAQPEGAATLAEVATMLRPVAPPVALRARLMASLSKGRLARFEGQVSKLLDIDTERAAELLDGIDEPTSFEPSPVPGVELYHVEGSEVVADAITGFVRIERGGIFPHHEHLGHEYVLVVQGAVRDTSSGEVFRPGDLATMTPGTAHALEVLPGPAVVYLAVVFEGLGIGGDEFKPGDPRI